MRKKVSWVSVCTRSPEQPREASARVDAATVAEIVWEATEERRIEEAG